MFSWGQITSCIAALVIVCPFVSAQVFRVNAGSSDQYNSSGGSLEISTSRLTSGIGLGMVNGNLRTGAYLRQSIRNYSVILGDQTSLIDLPTDQFGSGEQVEIRGLSVGRSNHVNQAFVFAGFKSLSYGAPFFRAAETQEVVGIILFSHRFNERLKFYSRNLISGEKTSIQALEWKTAEWMKVSISGGVGSGKPYGALATNLNFAQFTVKAAYIRQGNNFRRASFDSVVVSEPTGANLSVNWRPSRRLSTDYSHVSLKGADLQHGTLPAATMDSVGVNWNSRPIRAGGNFFTSTVLNRRTNAFSLYGGRKIGNWVDLNVNWLQSKAHFDKSWSSSLIGTLRENISPRLELTQFITHSNGNTTASFGGNWIGNRLSFGMEYQTIYVPYIPSKPFSQAAVINLRLRTFRSLQLHVGSAVGADGKVRHTTWVDDLIVRNAGLQSPVQGTMVTMPKYIIRGQVTDDKGKPIRGAALLIGKEIVYTDEYGMFFVRLSKHTEFTLVLSFDEFLVPGYWEKVVGPERVSSEIEEKAPNLEIVLRRISREQSRQRQLQQRDGKAKAGAPAARAAL